MNDVIQNQLLDATVTIEVVKGAMRVKSSLGDWHVVIYLLVDALRLACREEREALLGKANKVIVPKFVLRPKL